MFAITRADTILLLALVVVAPAYSYYAGRRIVAGALPNRTMAYVRTMLSWWLITLAMASIWARMERPAAALGLTIPHDARSFAGAILCVLALAYVNGQWRVLRRMSADKLESVRRSFGRTLAVLPHTPAEYRLFLGVSLTAGICEELLFRGYFFAMTAPRLPLAGAIVASAAIFGLGHAYQGARGVAKTTAAGLFLGALYAGTGSLLWPIVLHVLIDVQGGSVGYRLLRTSRAVYSDESSHCEQSTP